MTDPKQKTETLNLRVSAEFKAALVAAAARERRSMANMIESLVFDYCQKNNLTAWDTSPDAMAQRERR